MKDSSNTNCGKTFVASYFDGEMAVAEELSFEKHLDECSACRKYLNSLKMVSSSIEIYLDDNEPELSESFTREITAVAQNNVEGLKDRKERSRALLVLLGLMVLLGGAIVARPTDFLPFLGAVAAQVLVVANLFGHFVYSLALAFSHILGGVCVNYVFKSTLLAMFAAILAIVSFLVFSKHFSRQQR
ncbi:MAG: zf-HC2 domain-containing protein [Pyrinomonadaceae bacterium]